VNPHMASLIAEENIILFQKIKQVVEALPDIKLGKDTQGRKARVSCHMIARGLARIFPEVTRHDGYFVRLGQRHSWLTVRNDPGLIIDAYPVALLGGPIMVHCGLVTTPWDHLYIKARLPRLGGQEFRKHVSLVTRALKETLECRLLSLG